jgi:hypothetical protein
MEDARSGVYARPQELICSVPLPDDFENLVRTLADKTPQEQDDFLAKRYEEIAEAARNGNSAAVAELLSLALRLQKDASLLTRELLHYYAQAESVVALGLLGVGQWRN